MTATFPDNLIPLTLIPQQKTKNSVALALWRIIPSERPPLIGDVCANIFG
jgi:hypothetical protein